MRSGDVNILREKIRFKTAGLKDLITRLWDSEYGKERFIDSSRDHRIMVRVIKQMLGLKKYVNFRF